MKRPAGRRLAPPDPQRRRSTAAPSPRVSTIPRGLPVATPRPPKPRARAATPKPTLRPPKLAARPSRHVARIVDDSESTLVDLLDNLLGKGVMLNADVILALANVDLVYIRLSALLCAADRVLPARGRR